jgi:hypothetical protein
MRPAKPIKALSKGKQRRSAPEQDAEDAAAEAPSADEALDLHQRPTTAPPRSGVQHSIPVFEPSRVPRISLKTG